MPPNLQSPILRLFSGQASNLKRLSYYALGLGWIVFVVFALSGIDIVPFHPDESTQIYMSRDFDTFVAARNLKALYWTAENESDPALNYRLLDAPISRYLIGVSRHLAGHTATSPNNDWNWSLSWEENVQAGALPAPDLLPLARIPATVLTSLAPLLIFKIGRRLGGDGTGVAAAVLYALNSLVLLHGRRAMAEGPMLFFSLLAFFVILRYPKRPLLVGCCTALAVAAKQSALALVVVGLFALVWWPSDSPPGLLPDRLHWRTRMRALALGTASFAAVTLLLNPILWRSPLGTLEAMVRARQNLLAAQTAAVRTAGPGMAPEAPVMRAAAMVYHVYFAPLAFWDVANYANETRIAELQYLSTPLHHLLPNPSQIAGSLGIGGLLLALTLAGLAFGIIEFRRRPSTRRTLTLLWMWTLVTVGGIWVAVQVAWQRYYMPLTPITTLWAAYGLLSMLRPLTQRHARHRSEPSR